MNRLLTKDPDERIGSQLGATEILQHPWFSDPGSNHYIDIESVKNRTADPDLDESFFEKSSMKLFDAKPMQVGKNESIVNA